MDSNDTELKIVLTMIEYGEPLICLHIAKKSKLDQQLVAYHIKNMLEKGILLKEEAENKKYYYLQPVFYDKTAIEMLFLSLTPFVEQFPKGIDFEKCENEDSIKVSSECFQTLLKVFQNRLTKLVWQN